MEDFVTELCPVSEWTWELFEVKYSYDDAPGSTTLWLVSTDTHIREEVWRACPNHDFEWASWSSKAVVSRPHQVGVLHGVRIDEGARAAGEREARARGLI